MRWEREGAGAGALGGAGDREGGVWRLGLSSPLCWGMEPPGWAVLADMGICGAAVTGLPICQLGRWQGWPDAQEKGQGLGIES